MQITQYRTRARGLAGLLLPFTLVEDGILLQQDGSPFVAWSYRSKWSQVDLKANPIWMEGRKSN